MRTDLRDRLADLAQHTPSGSPPPDLWRRGVRRHRVVQTGRVIVAAVLVALVGLGGWSWHSSRPVQPADTHGSPHLPDRLYDPSPWLASFNGPPGQLVALLPADRKSLFQTTAGLVGVTASTGQYGFLDLPSDAVTATPLDVSPPSLSPDGRHVAFWTTGSPSGTANTRMLGVTITGVGVYDSESGRVEQAPLATVHGLDPELLDWADDHTLVLGLDQTSFGDEDPNSCCEGHWEGLATWDIEGTAGPVSLRSSMPLFVSDPGTSAGGGVLVWPSSGRRVHVIDPVPPGHDQPYGLSASAEYASLSPDHARLAVVSNPRRGRLLVGRMPTSRSGGHVPRVRLRPATSAAGFDRVVAWWDDEHVVVERRIEEKSREAYRLDVVDLSTGRAHVLVRQARTDHQLDPTGSELATGLLSAPVAVATAPPRPWDRRTLGIVVLVGLALLGLITWGARAGRA